MTALRYILEFAIIIPGVIFAVMPVLDDLRVKSVSFYGAVITALILIGSFVRYKFSLMHYTVITPIAILMVIIYFLVVNASPGRKLFCVFTSSMLCMFSRFYTVFVMAPFEAENSIWYTTGLLTFKSGIICLIFALMIGGFFSRTLLFRLPMLMKQENISQLWKVLFLVPMFMTMLIWWIIPVHPEFAMVGRIRPASLIILGVMLMMILLLYNIFWWIAEKFSERSRLQQENTLLMMEGKRYKELRSYMNETRALRHDFRQHILVITQLASSESFTELKDYLQKFTDTYGEKILTGGGVQYSKNVAVDATASYYTSYAEAHGAKIDWRLNLPPELPINEAEYCAMLGNLTENALKAAANLPEGERNVKIISSMLTQKIIGLSIDNPFTGKINFDKNGLPVSSENEHGIGLISVFNTVQRYDGTINITTENNIFSVDIILYCK
ncbi:MAG: GHKL domain-containing protein [Synergistaceae bacterium]|nr:GHKL domain-containing protein [Synergistaceae bacterium]